MTQHASALTCPGPRTFLRSRTPSASGAAIVPFAGFSLSPALRDRVAGLAVAGMLAFSMAENGVRVGRIATTALFLTVVGWAFLRGELPVAPLRRAAAGVGLLLAVLLVTCATSLDPAWSLKTFFQQHFWFAALLLAMGGWATTAPRQRMVLRGLAVAGAFASMAGILLFFFGEPLERLGWLRDAGRYVHRAQTEGGEVYFRARGLLESYTRSALLGVVTLPAAVAVGLLAQREGRRAETCAALVAVLLGVAYLLLTKSRAGWLGAGLTCAVTWWCLRGPRWVLAAGGTLLLGVALLLPVVRQRAFTLVQDVGRPDVLLSGRLDLWKQGWRAIADHPVTGIGYGGNIFLRPAARDYQLWKHDGLRENQPDLHSAYLQVLAEGGVLGGIAYGVFAVFLLGLALGHLRHPDPELPGSSVAAACFVAFLLIGIVYAWNEAQVAQIAWITFGMLLAPCAAGWHARTLQEAGVPPPPAP